MPIDKTEALLDQLDALADQAHVVIRAVREPVNVLRRMMVEAKQTVQKMRKVDVEI